MKLFLIEAEIVYEWHCLQQNNRSITFTLQEFCERWDNKTCGMKISECQELLEV